MKSKTKIISRSILTLISIAGFSVQSHAASGSETLTVYAGPQSVAAREIIHVTVELTDFQGANLNNEKVELSFNLDGEIQTRQAITRHGLVSIDIEAGQSAGLMKFSARYKNVQSNEALVTVVAGPPEQMSLKIVPAAEQGRIEVSSDVLTDSYGNAVSDLSLISLGWINEDGLLGTESLQLSKGQIDHALTCPTSMSGALKLRATLNSLEFISSDISAFCRSDVS